MTETRYRAKPFEIEARQLLGSEDGEPARTLAAWCGGWIGGSFTEPRIVISTLEGERVARPGDWIVRSAKGEFYPVRGSVFAERYEPAAVPSAPADRAALSARLWKIAEHHIVAEWICCEPLDPKHELCAKGYAALGMARTLLVDSPEAWNPAAPLLDAVLAELRRGTADRAALLADEAALIEAHCPDHGPQDQDGVWMDCHCPVAEDMRKRAAELSRMADEAQQPVCPTPESHNWGCGCPGDRLPLYSDRGVDTPGCDCGHSGMGMRWHDGVGCAWFKRLTEEGRRLLVDDPADEAQQPETQAENPARIDGLRPEFTDHASVESIDVQLRRARSQLRRWHLRVEWLISLRQARLEQKERGEWPAAVSQPAVARQADTAGEQPAP